MKETEIKYDWNDYINLHYQVHSFSSCF